VKVEHNFYVLVSTDKIGYTFVGETERHKIMKTGAKQRMLADFTSIL